MRGGDYLLRGELRGGFDFASCEEIARGVCVCEADLDVDFFIEKLGGRHGIEESEPLGEKDGAVLKTLEICRNIHIYNFIVSAPMSKRKA